MPDKGEDHRIEDKEGQEHCLVWPGQREGATRGALKDYHQPEVTQPDKR